MTQRFRYIETYLDGKQLLGSDFTRVLPLNIGRVALNNRLNLLKATVTSLSRTINPYLTKGVLTFKIV